MDIINKTSLCLSSVKGGLITRVVYDYDKALSINKSQTYRRLLTEALSLGSPTQVFIHDLNGRVIREIPLNFQGKEVKASNAQSFFDFIKAPFRTGEVEQQTIARYELSPLTMGDEFSWASRVFRLEPTPWVLSQKLEFRSTPINPIVHSLDYYLNKNQVIVFLYYPIQSESLITVTFGASHESSHRSEFLEAKATN